MRNALRLLPLLALAAPLAAQTGPAGPGRTPPAEAARAAATITAEDYYRRIAVLADDSMRGRDTPSPELDEVAAWIGSEFQRFGLGPGGDDGSYIQRYPVLSIMVDLDASSLGAPGGRRLAFGRDVLPLSSRGARPVVVRGSGPVVVVSGSTGAGSALEGVELSGAHVVLVPAGGSGGNVLRNRAMLELLRGVLEAGPRSVIVAVDDGPEAWREQVTEAATRTSVSLQEPGEGTTALLRARDGALRTLLDGVDLADLRADAEGPVTVHPVPGLTLELNQRVRVVERESAPNVVGILRGSDPELRDQYVVFSGHMDHVGVGRPDASGDSIYNGADDDASGTVTVMEVAEAMASLPTPPRRSMIFLTVSGEEKGLWGSSWFAAHPPVPTEQMVADLNADMVGRNWSDTIVAIGRQHSDLGETLARVDAAHPELNMAAIDDRWPEENFYRRSDHFNFARRGVPILFFFNGTHEDYHRPSDELEKIDTDKAARIGRLLFYLGLEVADADQPPRWNPESYRSIVDGAAGGG